MDAPVVDQLTLHLDWSDQPPLVSDAGQPAESHESWAAGLRRTYLRLWQELLAYFNEGWALAGEEPDHLHWHSVEERPGRLRRTGCTVQLVRQPPYHRRAAATVVPVGRGGRQP